MAKHAAQRSSGSLAYWGLVLKDFARAWFVYGVIAVIIAGITHGIFHIPLWQVTDVILALFLFYIGFVASLSLIALCLDLTRGEIVLAVGRLFNIAMLPFLPFGAVLGFMGYGWLVGQDFATDSFVHAGYMDVFADAYRLAMMQGGDFLALVKPSGEVGAGSIDMAQLALLAQVASVLLAFAGYLVSRSRVALVTDDTLTVSPFTRGRD